MHVLNVLWIYNIYVCKCKKIESTLSGTNAGSELHCRIVGTNQTKKIKEDQRSLLSHQTELKYFSLLPVFFSSIQSFRGGCAGLRSDDQMCSNPFSWDLFLKGGKGQV